MWLSHTFTRFYSSATEMMLFNTTVYWLHIEQSLLGQLHICRFHFTCQICLAIGNVLYWLRYLKILRPRFFFSIFLKSPYPYPHVAFFNRFCPSTRKRNVDRKRHHQLCAFTDIKHRDQNGYMWVGREIRKTDPYPYLRMSKTYLDLLKMP